MSVRPSVRPFLRKTRYLGPFLDATSISIRECVRRSVGPYVRVSLCFPLFLSDQKIVIISPGYGERPPLVAYIGRVSGLFVVRNHLAYLDRDRPIFQPSAVRSSTLSSCRRIIIINAIFFGLLDFFIHFA